MTRHLPPALAPAHQNVLECTPAAAAPNPSWAGFTTVDVLAAVSADEELAVVFLADGAALHAGHGALLAVSTLTREECESDEEFEAEGGEFRTAPAGIHEIHANLMIANLDFSDFADAAEAAPDGVFRSL
ncbi:hypothetical protein OOK36_19530 [Streptomyces sp. NBC_00365]|uniref:DUF6924 domain-containing protein n=1 Tax=Streptomyces sp. NBC_00365 TaxID=2975726 RepID=UPI002257B0AD|nr:hypothetical protein [Streptomyces sp. NBC_00365]MCX5091051.1 hypothetical protein [Streptomyces sp. NBC_00365]